MKNTVKTIFIFAVVLLFGASFVSAVSQQELNEAKNLIDSKADCKGLSDGQLEKIGEYYMEQMHPGEAHRLMEQIMGLEGNPQADEQFHINMARHMYCGEGRSHGMMGIMGSAIGMMGGNMMPGMMQMAIGGMMNSYMQGNMMGSYGMMNGNNMMAHHPNTATGMPICKA